MRTTTAHPPTRTMRLFAVTGLAVVALGLAACSSGSAASSSSTTSASTSAPSSAPTSTLETTVTDVVTSTAEVTRTEHTTTAGGAAGNGGTGGDDHSGSTPNPCPDPATLGSVTPNYDPQYPINSINCSGEWAVGTYEADGKNQTTGIWRNASGSWVYQDRAAVCAVAANLPPELYKQACTGS